METNQSNPPKPKKQRKGRMYSVPITDKVIWEFIDFQADRHKSGRTGYFRDLVKRDMAEYQENERLRQVALAKLTQEERAALGYYMRGSENSYHHYKDRIDDETEED